MSKPYDPQAENERFNVKERAQHEKMGNADPFVNPRKEPRTNEPNAGGVNRETGNRRGHQNER